MPRDDLQTQLSKLFGAEQPSPEFIMLAKQLITYHRCQLNRLQPPVSLAQLADQLSNQLTQTDNGDTIVVLELENVESKNAESFVVMLKQGNSPIDAAFYHRMKLTANNLAAYERAYNLHQGYVAHSIIHPDQDANKRLGITTINVGMANGNKNASTPDITMQFYYHVISEFIPGGNVASMMSKWRAKEDPSPHNIAEKALSITIDYALMLQDLLAHGLTFFDGKATNILSRNNGGVSLGDFKSLVDISDYALTSQKKPIDQLEERVRRKHRPVYIDCSIDGLHGLDISPMYDLPEVLKNREDCFPVEQLYCYQLAILLYELLTNQFECIEDQKTLSRERKELARNKLSFREGCGYNFNEAPGKHIKKLISDLFQGKIRTLHKAIAALKHINLQASNGHAEEFGRDLSRQTSIHRGLFSRTRSILHLSVVPSDTDDTADVVKSPRSPRHHLPFFSATLLGTDPQPAQPTISVPQPDAMHPPSDPPPNRRQRSMTVSGPSGNWTSK